MGRKYFNGLSLRLLLFNPKILLKDYVKKHRFSTALILVLAIGFVLGTHHEAAVACGGFLCGPKNELTGALNQTDNSTELIDNAFLGMNAFVVLIIAVPLIAGAVKGVGRDEIGWYIGGSVVLFVLMLSLNYMGDWVFGIVGGTGGGAVEAGTAAGEAAGESAGGLLGGG